MSLAFQDVRSSPCYWMDKFPGFCWAPIAYDLLAQTFVNDFEGVLNKKRKIDDVNDNDEDEQRTLRHKIDQPEECAGTEVQPEVPVHVPVQDSPGSQGEVETSEILLQGTS